VPADIAQDIQSISEEGVIYRFKKEEREELNSPQAPLARAAEQPRYQQEEQVLEAEPEVVKEAGPLAGSRGPLAARKRVETSGPLQKRSRVKLRAPGSRGQGGKTINYVVKKGDTLMEISFDKHGDYLRWREIYRDNRSKMSHWTKMRVGTMLTINNVNYVYIQKNGKPYFIQKGDTLKSIAQKLYGSPLMWKALWKNNPQLIRKPNKLYAGFTLYYQPKGQRQQTPEARTPTSQGVLQKQVIKEDPKGSTEGSATEILKDEFQTTD
ncbi:MAG: LysM peptidoglycan-binding domain-containing protein, partial [Pseudomonadota bacterium]